MCAGAAPDRRLGAGGDRIGRPGDRTQIIQLGIPSAGWRSALLASSAVTPACLADSDPAPARSWSAGRAFPGDPAKTIRAAGLVCLDAVVLRRLQARLLIEHGTRRVHPAGSTVHPTGERVTQQDGHLLRSLEDHAGAFKIVIRDRDAQFTAALDAVFTAIGAPIIIPPRSPRADATAARRVRPACRECLGQMLITSERHR